MNVPTLTYASRTEAVVALKAQGLTTAEVAARLGISSANASTLECYARRGRAYRSTQSKTVRVKVPREIMEKFAPDAAKRHIHPSVLVQRLIKTISDLRLVGYILDDEAAQ